SMKYVPRRALSCQYTPETSTPKVRRVWATCCPSGFLGRRDHQPTRFPNRDSAIAMLLSAPPTFTSSVLATSRRVWPGGESRHMVSPSVMRSKSVLFEDVVGTTFLSHLMQNILG